MTAEPLQTEERRRHARTPLLSIRLYRFYRCRGHALLTRTSSVGIPPSRRPEWSGGVPERA